ncbi:MAG: hypothetical protein AAF630_09500 [Cyanobacteria bacterium P01_C01_bin.38]
MATKICVNSHKIKSNRKNNKNEPVLKVKQGSQIDYCHEFEIFGKCRVIYRPNNPLDCGAQVWGQLPTPPLSRLCRRLAKPSVY